MVEPRVYAVQQVGLIINGLDDVALCSRLIAVWCDELNRPVKFAEFLWMPAET